MTELTTATPDNLSLHVRLWEPARPPRAVVQIVHGMAEHSGRYLRFADALVSAGFAVIAHDHRGHGVTGGADATFARLIADISLVRRDVTAQRDWRSLPVVLFGHSMGSFLARGYAARCGGELTALVLSSTATDPGLPGWFGQAIALGQSRIQGRDVDSKALDRLIFSGYNRGFRTARTAFDWISSDPDEVDAYIDDPFCGTVMSAGFYAELLGGLRSVSRPATYRATRPDLPVLVFGGDRDPVGGIRGAGPAQVAAAYRAGGSLDVTLTTYVGGRHELLHDVTQSVVTADIIAWLDRVLSSPSPVSAD